ncbi:hypothetical protein IWW50_001674, partial [Coemansia erecta]
PNWAPEEDIKKLEALLPARQPAEPIPKGYHAEDVVLSAVDLHHQKKMSEADGAMDEDYEDAQHGPGVQCAQQ